MSERVAVFGAGISGQAARLLAEKLGHEVTVFDQKSVDYARFDPTDSGAWDRFVFSPGFAADHPWRRAAESTSVPCQSEVAFAAAHWKGRLIGVTGTNGKTSLTRLLTESLQCAGQSAVAVGNIGQAFAEIAAGPANLDATWAVCELSSFQAELPEGLQLDGLIWTNFAEDHLDRYPDLDAYFQAKANLLGCLREGAPVALGCSVRRLLAETGRFYPECPAPQPPIQLPVHSPFAGRPQSENFALASQLWNALGFNSGPLIETAQTFKLDPHRCALVGTVAGVEFWDDSKATNFHATEAALQRMRGPVFWIGGGAAKGGDVDGFVRRIAPQMQAAFVYGAVGEQLRESFDHTTCPVTLTDRFEAAVHAAAHAAFEAAPAVVLMSPGFASFDQFLTYSQRGKSFISIVLGLMDRPLTN